MASISGAGRLHAFDNLRAIMMWLGIVLHVAVNHMSGPTLLPLRDSQVTAIADLTLVFIHAFRMPVFFIIAGYLAALMVDSGGVKAMLRNRVRRLALPFAVFWPILVAATVLLVFVFRHLMVHGTIGFDLSLAPKPVPGMAAINTMHLWFVYYLFLFCLLAGAACKVEQYIPVKMIALARKVMEILASRWWGFLILAIPLTLAGFGYPAGVVKPSGSFIPNLSELVHGGAFFLYGWTLFRCRELALPLYMQHRWRYLLGGLVPFVISGVLYHVYNNDPGSIPHLSAWIAFAYGSTSWLWSIALIGLFLKYLPRQNRILKYVSDSSYWVFLVHMLGTIGFGILLYNAALGGVTKMAINVLATTAACLASYHLFVRHTWIGVLLNGRRKQTQVRNVISEPA